MKKKNKLIDLMIILLILIGILIMAYPFISQYYYKYRAEEEITNFRQALSEKEEAEIDENIELATVYNASLVQGKIEDPFDEEIKKQAFTNYARMLELKELIGSVKIPKIAEELPVYAGTSEDVLQKGVGHLEGTSLPIGGENTHSVITAHRGLPTARLFTDLDQLEIGDRFYYSNIKETLAYQVVEKFVVEPTDFEPIMLEEGKDYMTLLTCTPYMINSHRLLVRGERIEYEESQMQDLDQGQTGVNYKKILYPLAFIIIVLVILVIFTLYRRRKLTRELEKAKKEKTQQN